jgi:outer membrane protein OmpA-like peptidoglycan-associated protein
MNARATALLFLVAGLPLAARAGPPVLDLDRLSLEPGGEGSLVLQTGDGLRSGELRLTLAAHYQRDPLQYREGGRAVADLVGYRLGANLAAAYGLADFLETAIELPLVLSQDGDEIPGVGTVRRAAVGSPFLRGRFTLLREAGGAPLDLGASLGVSLPIGSDDALVRNPGVAIRPGVGVGRTFGSAVRAGLDASLTLREKSVLSPYSVDPGDDLGNELDLGLGASTLGEGLRGEIDLVGHLPLADVPASLELLGGARYPLAGRTLETFALAGPGLGWTPGTPRFRALAGLAWTPGAGPVPSPGAARPPAAANPALAPASARPAIGATPVEGVAALPSAPALPAAATAEKPPEAGPVGPGGPPEIAGPAAPTRPATVATTGAATAAPVETVAVDETILFGFASARLTRASREVLDGVAARLLAAPGLRVRIEGHADSTGPHAVNVRLSRVRAREARTYLVERGIAADRIETAGFGPDRPVSSNRTADGRRRNRRVEVIAAGGVR